MNNSDYLNMIEDVAGWLHSTREAYEDSKKNDAVIRYACKEGARRLRGILEQIDRDQDLTPEEFAELVRKAENREPLEPEEFKALIKGKKEAGTAATVPASETN